VELFRGGSLRLWVEASSLVAAALYAMGWIFVAGVFASFDVTPEEVGFTFASLLIRVAGLLIAVLAFVVLVVVFLERFGIVDIAKPLEDERTIWIAIAGFVVVSGVPFFITVGWRRENFWLILCVLVALVAAVVGQRLTARPRIRFTLALISVAAFLVVPLLAANQYADLVEDGHELRPRILPGIAGLSIQLVQATSIDDEPISPDLGPSACVHLLGSSGGTVVLYKHEEDLVIRVPQERVSLEDRCIRRRD
jgi:hypothetical protein